MSKCVFSALLYVQYSIFWRIALKSGLPTMKKGFSSLLFVSEFQSFITGLLAAKTVDKAHCIYSWLIFDFDPSNMSVIWLVGLNCFNTKFNHNLKLLFFCKSFFLCMKKSIAANLMVCVALLIFITGPPQKGGGKTKNRFDLQGKSWCKSSIRLVNTEKVSTKWNTVAY